MKKINLSLLIKLSLIISLFGVTACNNTTNSVSENNSTPVENPAPSTAVNRIVALTSLSADIIQQLEPTKLVGIPGSSLLKEDSRFNDLVMVSEGRTPPDLEKIMALEPDLVVGAEGFSDQILTRLEELGVKTMTTNINSWASLLQMIEELATVTGADAEPLINRYQAMIPDNLDSNSSILILVSRQPILAPNKNSWTGDLLTQFKYQNVVADLQGSSEFGGYVTLSPEKILETNPEKIIIVDPAREGILEQLKKEPFWSELTAVKEDKIYDFDYYGLVNPGSMKKVEETLIKLAQEIK
ncbi:MAG: ABC transporter substrate-binding protein [Cyanobacterium sp. T60_A2020_053]|nr:ABC transporter substrate-binding protein [Cyanobacterium sp. T60_A2020_053]